VNDRSPIAHLTVVALACLALVGCTRGASVYAGRVADDVVTVQAPGLSVPAANLDAGFAGAQAAAGGMAGGAASGASARSAVSTIAATTGIGSVARVARVAVRPGDVVTAGQELAAFETGVLSANVAVAKAAELSARAQVPVIDSAIDTARTASAKLSTTRTTVRSAIAKLTTTRAQLADKLATLKALATALQRSGGRPTGGSAPGRIPTGTVPPGKAPGGPPSRPTGGAPSPAQLRATIAQLEAGIAKLDAGLAQARAGLAKLSAAKSTLADARVQLRDLRDLVSLAADASALGVRASEYQRSLATVSAPVGGVVVRVASIGDVLAPGATVAVIRRAEDERVTTWIAPAELAGVHVGDTVRVGVDWATGTRRGRVSIIGARADYPPTSYPTKDVHLTRAVPIEVVMDDGVRGFSLPPGAPADVEFVAGR